MSQNIRPDIIVFLTDDHGPWAGNVFGTPEIRTLALDSLATDGTLFKNAYTPCPVCSPARASFWTGLYPSQHGIHDWIKEKQFDSRWMPDVPTLATLLQKSGYKTGFVGKWHCGQSWIQQPGFDFYVGENRDQYPHRGVCQFVDNGEAVTYIGQRIDFITNRAIDFLSDTKDNRPRFLFVGHVDTHSPFADHPAHIVKHYVSKPVKSLPVEKYVGEAIKQPGLMPSQIEHERRMSQYAAAVEVIDTHVGRILDLIDAQKRRADTCVVYTSDHGHMNGHHGLYYKGNATIPQNFYDESIRVPSIIRYPKVAVAGAKRDEWISHCDLFASLLDIAHVPLPAITQYPYAGVSILPLLKGNNSVTWRDHAICEYGNARMIRTKQIKVIRRSKPHVGDEVYDMLLDPRETKNVRELQTLQGVINEADLKLTHHFQIYSKPSADGFGQLKVHNGGEPWA